jgi:cation:H+ antiporter
MMNALIGGGSVLRGKGAAHTLSSSFGLALTALALLGIVLISKFSAAPRVAQAAELTWTALIAIAYLGCMRLVYAQEQQTIAAGNNGDRPARQGVRRIVYVQVLIMAVIIVGASWWLARICDTLAVHEIRMIRRPLGSTFVGAGFLALATSLPEIVTSITAVRLKNLDMALGNIFGSNMFNIFVIPVLKAVSLVQGEPLLLAAGAVNSAQNLITGLLAILLSAVAVGGLTYQSRSPSRRRFGLDSILIAIIYLGGMALLLARPGV